MTTLLMSYSGITVFSRIVSDGNPYNCSYNTIRLIIFMGIIFHGLGSSDIFVGLYFCGIPTLIT